MGFIESALLLVLINADFPVANLATGETYPCAAYKNDQYYVFWTDTRNNPLYSLFGARVNTGGTVLDPGGKMLATDSVFNPRAAYDGANFLVVWREGC